MMRTDFGIAAALTRAWVRLYTIGMPADLRETRRGEIEADLWDQEKDAHEKGIPAAVSEMEILLRAVLGVPDDLSWRFEAIQARRAASLTRRIPMWSLSTRQLRWMGLAGLLSGFLWAGNVLTLPTKFGSWWAYGHIALSILFIVGLLGVYMHHREQAGTVGKAGFILLFASFAAWSALNILNTGFGVDDGALAMDLLGVTWVFLLPPGFLLLGIGLKGPGRAVPLVVGCAFAMSFLIPRAAFTYLFPSVTNWPGEASPLGAVAFFIMGVGLALMGYSVFRNAAPIPNRQ